MVFINIIFLISIIISTILFIASTRQRPSVWIFIICAVLLGWFTIPLSYLLVKNESNLQLQMAARFVALANFTVIGLSAWFLAKHLKNK